MTIPDLNALVYAYNTLSPIHAKYREWWEHELSGDNEIGLPWMVILGFVRLSTGTKAFETPLPVSRCLEIVDSWLAQPNVVIIKPGPGHFRLLKVIMSDLPASPKLVMDAHLAALAIEFGATVVTHGKDFKRFPNVAQFDPADQ